MSKFLDDLANNTPNSSQFELNSKQYCIYTRDFDCAPGFIRDLSLIGVLIEPHANRTRFWLDTLEPTHYLFYLKYADVLHSIDHEQDHAQGL